MKIYGEPMFFLNYTAISKLLARHDVKVRFILVGSWAVIFSYLVFVGLYTFFLYVYAPRYVAYMMAAILANIIAILNSFILHKYVTFKSKVKGKGILIEFIKFCTTYSVTFCLSVILLPIFVEICHIPPKLSGALIIPVCAVINYLGNLRFAFRQHRVEHKDMVVKLKHNGKS